MLFTIFTAAFNRAWSLPRTYESLLQQSTGDFEWVLVDDGSTDQTSVLVERWAAEAPFPVRYFYQRHRGKHVAFNAGVRQAAGELFVSLDSDDQLKPDALLVLRTAWFAIPERQRYSGLQTLCEDQYGLLVGTRFPSSPLDVGEIVLKGRLKVRGDKMRCRRTDVLRQYPFPEVEGIRFIPESFITYRIDRHYKSRCINAITLVYWQTGDGSDQLTRSIDHAMLAPGRALFGRVALKEQIDQFFVAPRYFFNIAVNYVRNALHAGKGLWQQREVITGWHTLVLWLLALPAGAYLWRRDLRRRGQQATRH